MTNIFISILLEVEPRSHCTTPQHSTTLYATCDNEMKIYFDGVLQNQDSGNHNQRPYAWMVTTELHIPSGFKVLGIECLNWGGTSGQTCRKKKSFRQQISVSVSMNVDRSKLDVDEYCSYNQNMKGWEGSHVYNSIDGNILKRIS
jgi:hypothetical protein